MQNEDQRRAATTRLSAEQAGNHRQQEGQRQERGIIAYTYIEGWTIALQQARQAPGVTGFLAVKKGQPLYTKAKEIDGRIYCQ